MGTICATTMSNKILIYMAWITSAILLLPANSLGSQYIDCLPGDLNVILASPHGGYEEPEVIPNRPRAGCFRDGQCVYEYDCGYLDIVK